MLNRVKFLPTPYVIYTQLRTHLSAQTTISERGKFAQCLPCNEPISFHEIFKTLYYLPLVPASHKERVRCVAKFIWKLGEKKKILKLRRAHPEKRFLPHPIVIFTHLSANLSSSIAPLDRIQFAKRFCHKKPITHDRLLRKLYYMHRVAAVEFDRIELIANFIWRLGTTDKTSRLMQGYRPSDSESLSDRYCDHDLCPTLPAASLPSCSLESNSVPSIIKGLALAHILGNGCKTKYHRRKYTSYNSVSEKSLEGSLPEGCSGSGTPLDLFTIGAYELSIRLALELVEKEGRPKFKKILEYTQKKKAQLLENFFNMETS